jgi:allantoicase
LIDVSDDFFASASNLLNPRPPIRQPGKFVATGAWYDGWESRRHNQLVYDYVIIRLGTAAGLVQGVEVDTAFFNGNHAPEISIEGVYRTEDNADDIVKAMARQESDEGDHAWVSLLSKKECGPSARHAWWLQESLRQKPITHVRLRMYPDGGIARFRVYGTAKPVWPADTTKEVELSAAQMGGLAIACSDQHFGVKDNLLLPGRGVDMGDGWERSCRLGCCSIWCEGQGSKNHY